MATVTTEMVKKLREETGAGVLDCKTALEETDGDMEKAMSVLREQGLAEAAKKRGREAEDGRVEAYVHHGNKLATLVEVKCETDFVARTEQFEELSHDLAMQIAAMDPKWVSQDDVPEEVIEEQKELYRSQMAGQNKPEHIMEKIIEGKLEKFYQQNCLMEQNFIRDEDKTIKQLVTEAIAQLGENIVVGRFARFQID